MPPLPNTPNKPDHAQQPRPHRHPTSLQLPNSRDLFLSSAESGIVGLHDASARRAAVLFLAATTLLQNLPVLWPRARALAVAEGPSLADHGDGLELLLMCGLSGLLLALAGLLGRTVLRLHGTALCLAGSICSGWLWQQELHADSLPAGPTDGAPPSVLSYVALVLLIGLLPALAWWRQAPRSWWRRRRPWAHLSGWLRGGALALVVTVGAGLALTALPPPLDLTGRLETALRAWLPSRWLFGPGHHARTSTGVVALSAQTSRPARKSSTAW